MKTLLISLQPINLRNYKRFQLHTLSRLSEIVILDASSLFYCQQYHEELSCVDAKIQSLAIHSYGELSKALRLHDDAQLIISLLGEPGRHTFRFYQCLIEYQHKLCVAALSTFPDALPRGPVDIPLTTLFKLRCKSLARYCLKYLYFSFKNWPKAPYCISSSTDAHRRYYPVLHKNSFVLKSSSYDKLLSLSVGYEHDYSDFVVFLHQAIPNHPDFRRQGYSPEPDSELYYAELNAFLRHVSLMLNKNVLIANHPRSPLSETRLNFPDFTVEDGRTHELCSSCSHVITHSSTAINFAVLSRKPILFITTDRLASYNDEIPLLASWFNKVPLNISNPDSYKLSPLPFTQPCLGNYYLRFEREHISHPEASNIDYEQLVNLL